MIKKIFFNFICKINLSNSSTFFDLGASLNISELLKLELDFLLNSNSYSSLFLCSMSLLNLYFYYYMMHLSKTYYSFQYLYFHYFLFKINIL